MQQSLRFITCRLCIVQRVSGRPRAHHQELNNCGSNLWFYRWSVVVAVLLVVVGPASRPDHDQQHCYHHAPAVKPETATAVVVLLRLGVRTPRNMLSCT